MQYTVKVESVSPIKRKLSIQVPSTEVKRQVESGLIKVQKKVKLKGFRAGHVPLDIVRKEYLKDVEHDVFHQMIEDSYRRALTDQKIKAVGQPEIDTSKHQHGSADHDHGIQDGQDLNFTAILEVLPEIEVKGYTGLSLTREKTDVTQDDVEKVIKGFLESQGELVPASGGIAAADGTMTSRAAKMGDFADIDFKGGMITDHGVEEKEGMKGSRTIELGSNSLIEGFEEQVVGMRSGETKTFKVTFPKDYHEKEIAGKKAEFTVTVNELKERKMPEFNDALVKPMGYHDVADFKKQAEDNVKEERKINSERKLRSDLLELLIEKNKFDIPAGLIQAQTRSLAQEVGQNLKQQGFTDQMVQEALMSDIDSLKNKAENQVRASLILEAIGKKENITVTDADLDAEMVSIAKNQGLEESKIRDFYVKNESRKADLEFRLKEDRTIQFLFEKSKIK